jgi:hypothetical protein
LQRFYELAAGISNSADNHMRRRLPGYDKIKEQFFQDCKARIARMRARAKREPSRLRAEVPDEEESPKN